MPSINLFSGTVDANGKLIQNPMDVLVNIGPVVDVVINITPTLAQSLAKAGASLPAPVQGKALIDTGARVTGIDDDLAKTLGLTPATTVQINSATETKISPVYYVSIDIPQATNFYIDTHPVVGMALAAQGIAMLIGRDILKNCHMTYNGALGLITISY